MLTQINPILRYPMVRTACVAGCGGRRVEGGDGGWTSSQGEGGREWGRSEEERREQKRTMEGVCMDVELRREERRGRRGAERSRESRGGQLMACEEEDDGYQVYGCSRTQLAEGWDGGWMSS